MAPHALVTILQTLVCLLLVRFHGALSADDSVQLSESFGGPHGTEFSDQASVAAGQTIGSITIRAGERVDGISLEVTAPTAATFSHGGSGGKANTLTLAKDEHITSMEAHWAEKKGRTRIFYLSFGTSAGNSVSAGSQTESKNTVKAPEGFQLGGFFGQDGDEIDKLGAIWTRISAEAPAMETPAAPAPAPAESAAGSTASSGSGPATESTAGSGEASAATSTSGSADSSGSAPKKKKPAASSEEASAAESVDDSGSAEAPAPKKKAGISAASEEATATASADDSGSAEAPASKKKKPATSAASADTSASADNSGSAEAPAPKKKKRATSAASEEASAAESVDDSGSAEAPAPKKKKRATSAASEEASAAESVDDSGSAEAPAPKKKKRATSAASEEASAAESVDDSGSAEAPAPKKKAGISAASEEATATASADDSGSAEAPASKKKKPATSAASADTSASADNSGSAEAPAPKKKKRATSAASEEASAAESVDDSGSAEAPAPKKKAGASASSTEGSGSEAPAPKKKAGISAASEEASATASADDSGSGEAPAPKKKKPAATAASDEASTAASADDSGSAEAPAPKKKVGASSEDASAAASTEGSGSAEDPAPKKKKPAASSASEETSTADDSESANAPAPKTKAGASAASEETSAVASTEGSATSFAANSAVKSSAATSTEASTAGPEQTSAAASAPGSAATSTEASTAGSKVAASTAGSAAEQTQGSAAVPAAGSGEAASTAGSAATSAAGSAAAPPAGTEAPGMSVKDSIVLSESFGGPHGMDFSDKNFVNSGQKVSQISIYAGKRLDGISLEITSPKTLTFTHGGTGGDRQVLKLGEGEYINSMEVHWGKKDDHTRIFYVNFKTSAGNSLAGGSMTDDKNTVTAPEGFQLAGFFGKSGKEIDALGAIWAYIDLVTPAPTPVPAATTVEDSPGTVAPEDIAGSLSEVTTKANKRPVQLSDSFGGPHGEQFSDQLACTSGMTVSSVTIRAGERLDGLTVQVSAPKEMTFTHGGTGGKENTLTLEPGEYITTMEAHWAQKSGHTRIFYLKLGTNKGNSVAGGSETKEKGSVTAPKGYQLAGFFGRYGDEIDLIGAVWSSIAAVNETSSTVTVSADEDIALGELFGGPHGNAFSDINDIKFGQTISAITIRSDKRVDAVTLKVDSPVEMIMNHGGRGGTEKTITLAADEVITSMEAHWDKKDKNTRVFYISFTTSAGQTISGGTKTENSGTATAPEGFVLSGCYGRGADEVDQIGAIWTRKTAKNIALTDPSGVGNGTYGTTIRNWVGPTIGKSSDTACYRKSMDFDSNNICPLGYSKDGDDCAARCPLSYPISCGLECIPQNDDCVLAALAKIGSVIAVALNAATGTVFGQILTAFKVAKWAVLCVRNLVEVIRGLIYYLRYRQTSAPVGDTAEMLTIAYQADVVLYDLPIAICTCLNLPVPKTAQFADTVLIIVEGIVKQAITNGDEIISTGANVMNLLTGNGMANKSSTTVDELEDLVAKNSSCGWELKRLTDRVTRAVLKYRNASSEVNDIRVKVYKSSIVLNDIPIVTNNCMGELLATKTRTAAYETRDLLRKTFGVIVDQLIETGKTDGGKDVAEDDYMLEVANMGLVVLSTIDVTGIAYMASQFVQPICGPTAYVGEIDDGTLYDALGLTTVDEAFEGSYGSYTHAGDGVVHLVFESVDTKDVTVVVHSGGDEYAKIDIGAGDVTTWDATFPELEDKTMYLDRWRPGLFGLPGKGGGSLLLWIPRSSEGGHITMHVRINPS